MKQPHVQGSSVVAQIGGQRDQAMLQKGETISNSKQDWAVAVVLVILVIVKVKTAIEYQLLKTQYHRYSSCGPCPRGQRSLGSLCRECKSPPLLYDW